MSGFPYNAPSFVSRLAGHAMAFRKASGRFFGQRRRKMPKMKTKSGAKKRFKFTATGKIKTHQVGKRHRLINNSPARTRDLRGMDLLSKSETQRVKRWMPYG